MMIIMSLIVCFSWSLVNLVLLFTSCHAVCVVCASFDFVDEDEDFLTLAGEKKNFELNCFSWMHCAKCAQIALLTVSLVLSLCFFLLHRLYSLDSCCLTQNIYRNKHQHDTNYSSGQDKQREEHGRQGGNSSIGQSIYVSQCGRGGRGLSEEEEQNNRKKNDGEKEDSGKTMNHHSSINQSINH